MKKIIRIGTRDSELALWQAHTVEKKLNDLGISAEVINIHTIKPLDEEMILNSVKKTGCVVTAEEHNYLGGMGESIAGMLSRKQQTPLEFVATDDCFGESGTPAQLMEKYGLESKDVVEADLRSKIKNELN